MEKLLELDKLIESKEAIVSLMVPVKERQNIFGLLHNTLAKTSDLPLYLWNLGEAEYFSKIEYLAEQDEYVALLDGFEIQAVQNYNPAMNAIAAIQSVKNYEGKGVFVLENIPSCMQNQEGIILRQLLINLYSDITVHNHSKLVILLNTDEVDLPNNLNGIIKTVELPYPDIDERTKLVSGYLPSLVDTQINPDLVNNLANTASGLHVEDIKAGLRQAVLTNREFSETDISWEHSLLNYKVNRFRSFNLNFVLEPNTYNFGGLDNFRTFIQQVKRDFQPDARIANIPLPKGCLLVGPPGTGKTLTAKVSAQELGFPLVSVDTGAIVAGGATYLKLLIQRVEACAPVVLYFDEFDKLFTTNTVSGEDSGSRHILGTLLTWLQDKQSQVFVIATLNRLDALPPELTRVGRFDEIFYVGFANAFERKQIISLHAARFDSRYKNGEPLTPKEWRIILIKL